MPKTRRAKGTLTTTRGGGALKATAAKAKRAAKAERQPGSGKDAAAAPQPVDKAAHHLDAPELRALLEGVRDGKPGTETYEITAFRHAAVQLAVAKQAAELANHEKSRFLAAASHDLRQPLQTLKFLHGALEQEVKDERARTLLGMMGRSLDSMAYTLTALRNIDQLEAGALRPTTPAVSPAQHPPAKIAIIFVVDDNRDIREAMRIVLTQAGYQVQTSADASSFLESYRPGDTGCLVVDVRMPGMSGLQMLAQLAAQGSKLPAIVITGQGDIPMAVEAMRAGAVDFIEKPVDPASLLASIDRALRQAASPSERSAARAAAALRAASLTRREREVMDLVVAGHLNKQIAARLGINQRTVETHRATVMKKMEAASLSELVRRDILARGL